ncbi:hypothetical protein SUGI_0193440 [Cryptomeria japonica]|uniref:uncharacterized protein LOC131054461 n=1 Tax=Cryptomeria japonica TaxID=3369 RepID=UPI002408BCD5|nr:uncharacterized protein LOC131054461 [Cryptomeria japonica]GLJ12556.1 hypothetical protein SUGI_0193440 [Cryptomeria japonica]
MAPRKKTGMKDFYSQKKKTSSKQKKAEAPGKSQVRSSAGKRQGDTLPATFDDARASSGTLGSSIVQPLGLKAYGRADYPDDSDAKEEILRQFDMNLTYGPCLGVPRLERWERASKLGLDPPKQIKELLEKGGGMPDCLWEGCV